MVNQCSYCVLKVPNDDGPSMSIIEFFLLFPLLPLQYGALGEQFNQLPQTLFFFIVTKSMLLSQVQCQKWSKLCAARNTLVGGHQRTQKMS